MRFGHFLALTTTKVFFIKDPQNNKGILITLETLLSLNIQKLRNQPWNEFGIP